MGDVQATRLNGIPNLNLYSFVKNFPNKVRECIELHFNKPLKKRDGFSTKTEFIYKDNSSIAELSLENQMYPWKQNPSWVDLPPEVKVTVPKGSLCNLNLKVNVGLPPEAVYNIVTDPDNKRVFKNIKEVISRKIVIDEGVRQVVEVEQAAIWRFLWWSGTISVHVLVDQNKEDYTMKFKQIKSGFMQRFEGSWKIEPIFIDEELCHPHKPDSLMDYISCSKGKGRIASKLVLEQLIQPSIVPPAPISWYLRGITTKTTEMLITDLLTEAARIRQDSSDGASNMSEEKSDDCRVCHDMCNIKERWAWRRKNARNCRRRLSLNSCSC